MGHLGSRRSAALRASTGGQLSGTLAGALLSGAFTEEAFIRQIGQVRQVRQVGQTIPPSDSSDSSDSSDLSDLSEKVPPHRHPPPHKKAGEIGEVMGKR